MIYSRSLIEPTPMCRQLEGAGRGESRPPLCNSGHPRSIRTGWWRSTPPDTAGELPTG